MKWILLLGCLFLVGCGITTGDPVGVQVTLHWTTPGDDGMVGQATAYDLRYSTELITEANWDNCPNAVCGLIDEEPIPGLPYFEQDFTFPLEVELGVNYYFCIKTVDDAGNWSLISNVVMKNFPDNIPPASIADLTAD